MINLSVQAFLLKNHINLKKYGHLQRLRMVRTHIIVEKTKTKNKYNRLRINSQKFHWPNLIKNKE